MALRRGMFASALVTLALSGCGADEPPSEEDQIRAMIVDLQEAWADGDTSRICNEMLPADYLAQSRTDPIEDRIVDCEEDLGSVPDAPTLRDLTIERIEIQGDTADVYWEDVGSHLDVSKVDGHWRWVIDD